MAIVRSVVILETVGKYTPGQVLTGEDAENYLKADPAPNPQFYVRTEREEADHTGDAE